MKQLLTHSRQLGEIARARRNALGISQLELAKKLSVSQNRLSELESNPAAIKLDRLVELLNLLGLDLFIQDRKDVGQGEW